MTSFKIIGILILLANSMSISVAAEKLNNKATVKKKPSFYAVNGISISIDNENYAYFSFRKSAFSDKPGIDTKNVTFFAGNQVVYGTLENGKPTSTKHRPDGNLTADDLTELNFKYKLLSKAGVKNFDFAILKRIEPKNLKLVALKSVKENPTKFFSAFVQEDFQESFPGAVDSIAKFAFGPQNRLKITNSWKFPSGQQLQNPEIFSMPLESCKFAADGDITSCICEYAPRGTGSRQALSFLTSEGKPLAYFSTNKALEVKSTFDVEGTHYLFSILNMPTDDNFYIFGKKSGVWTEYIEFITDFQM